MIGKHENYDLNVWKISDTEITVVLLGGKIDEYTIRLYKDGFGYAELESENVNKLTYSMKITEVNFNKGSLFGG